MRIAAISCVLLWLQNVTGSSLDFGAEMEKFFVKLKRALPCEFDGQKIEPFIYDKNKVGHRPVEFGSQDYLFKLDFSTLNMTGINTFQVLSSIFNRTSREYKLTLKPPRIHIMSNYILTQRLNGSILSGSLVDEGFIDLNMTRNPFTTTVALKSKRNGRLAINMVSFQDSTGEADPHYEYGKDLDRIVDLSKPIYHSIENEVFKMIGDLIKNKGNLFLSTHESIDDVTEALVDVIGPDDVGLFGQKLCNVGGN